mgnify:CR=1 FL=1
MSACLIPQLAYGNFRCVDDRCEVGATDTAQRRDRETGPLHVGWFELAIARLFCQITGFLRDLEDGLLIRVLDDGDDETIGRVGRKTDVPVVFVNQRIAIERAVELGEFLQRGHAGFDQERQHGDLDAALLVFLVGGHAESLEVGEIVRAHV